MPQFSWVYRPLAKLCCFQAECINSFLACVHLQSACERQRRMTMNAKMKNERECKQMLNVQYFAEEGLFVSELRVSDWMWQLWEQTTPFPSRGQPCTAPHPWQTAYARNCRREQAICFGVHVCRGKLLCWRPHLGIEGNASVFH